MIKRRPRFSDKFSTVFTKGPVEVPCLENRRQPSLSHIHITHEIKKALMKLKRNKSTYPDNIYHRILKIMIEE